MSQLEQKNESSQQRGASRIKSEDSLIPDPTGSRKMPRRLFSRPVGVLCSGRYAVCLALQLSEGGMLIQCSGHLGDALRVGQNIIISFILPGGMPISARAEVIYEAPDDLSSEVPAIQEPTHRLGIKFVPLSLQIRRSIRNYVSAKTQEEVDLDGATWYTRAK